MKYISNKVIKDSLAQSVACRHSKGRKKQVESLLLQAEPNIWHAEHGKDAYFNFCFSTGYCD